MASNTVKRYVWLLNTLMQRKSLTFKEICDLWDRSSLTDGKPLALRTFHQHREAIAELFGVEIVCDQNTYKYSIASPEELKNDAARQWLFNSFAIANTIEAGRNMKERILFEEIAGGAEYAQVVIDAMQQNRVLLVDYKPFKGEKFELYLQPYAMRVYNQRWYVVGRFKESGTIRNIALDRIQRMEITDEEFSLPEDFDARDYYSHTVGIFVNDSLKPQRVVLRTFGVSTEYMRSLPLHPSQREIATNGEEYSDFEYLLNLTPELTGKILSKGDWVEVLEPKELREEVKKYAHSIADLYKKRGFWR
ncbi:MAG: WYL domain-containing protein [Alistipes sp.]|nr:WYL domain-containing protein [Alistipes sp.]